ncbi:SatD family protein [Mycobacterium sp. SMC-4]|uniref:SatD family protein n=1 Tax=Mycobacterium sp. SMC-4 TaxID=2857059 RepID=UPI003CFD5133
MAALRATLIGDVVGSRQAADRRALHRQITAALAAVAKGALDAPAFTVGDEFQGSYLRVGEALAAAWAIRLAVAPGIDVRFGIGWGEISVLDAATRIQDGPGWWAARAAIEATAQTQRQPGLAQVRITYRNHAETGPPADLVNAALMCRDHMFGSLDERSIRILRGLMSHRSKKQLAAAEQISPSAVSQRAGRDGLDLIVLVSQYLSELS